MQARLWTALAISSLASACSGGISSSSVGVAPSEDPGRVTADASIAEPSDASVTIAEEGADTIGDAGGIVLDGAGSGRTSDADDAADEAIFDAEIPDAFPASCDQFAPLLVLRPDAAPHTCAFTPADVACETTSDCVAYEIVGCGCFDTVVGVNKTSTAGCIPPPCPPPLGACAASGLATQDCQVVASYDVHHVGVTCVNYQCMTYAAGP